MEKKSIVVSYDKDNDIISLFVSGKKVKFSFDMELPKGDIVIDFGHDGLVVGLEIFNASSYFPPLNKLEANGKLKGKMSAQYGHNWVQVSYEFSGPGMKEPVSRDLISPYNKEIIVNH